MACYIYFFTLIIATLGGNLVECAEFVPVYMWGTTKMSEHVPALHKISEDSFKDTLLEYLKKNPYIIVFAEHTLSPEDFAQRDQNGEIAFPHIFDLKKPQTYVTYKPYVQNPLGAIKQLDKKVTELSIGSFSSPNVPKDNILIINLSDAKDDEQRFHMLKRHDFDIVSIYKDILEQHDNVLAIYTAHHTSWVAPEEITRKKTRSLLQTEENVGIVFETHDILMYLSGQGVYNSSNNGDIQVNNITQNFTAEQTNNGTNQHDFTLSHNDLSLKFHFTLGSRDYWYINSVLATDKGNSVTVDVSDMYAPRRFSYHCGDLILSSKDKTVNISLPGFQVQLYPANGTFGDAYDCVGFTSVPIWSALFVTAILLLIMTFGLTMMMDIKTMDRFDDAKGKTITINASE